MNNNHLMKPIQNTSVVDTVVERITTGIKDGVWKAGEKIPSEGELAESFGIGRNSVREGIKILVTSGALEIHRGDGTFVTNGLSSMNILNPIIYSIIMEKDMEALVETRRMIENSIFTLAIEKATEEDLQNVDRAYEDFFREATTLPYNAEKMHEADVAFHAAITDCAHNKLLARIYDIIVEMSLSSRVRTAHDLIASNSIPWYIRTHKDMRDALWARDVQAEYALVEESFDHWRTLDM